MFFFDHLLSSYPCGVIIPLTMGPMVLLVLYVIIVSLVLQICLLGCLVVFLLRALGCILWCPHSVGLLPTLFSICLVFGLIFGLTPIYGPCLVPCMALWLVPLLAHGLVSFFLSHLVPDLTLS